MREYRQRSALPALRSLRGKRKRLLRYQVGIFVGLLAVLHLLFNSAAYFGVDPFGWSHPADRPVIQLLDGADTQTARSLLQAETDGTPLDLLLNNSPDESYKNATNKYVLVLHMMGVLYMFVGLAVVCDEYFVAALEEMCDRWSISEDVAGATFMAAGGSAPELFTSIMGVFVVNSDVGFGTIVGSAVFNVLFVIGLCAIFAHQELELTWWPLARDCSFYTFGLLVLVICVEDSHIHWYEALALLCCYFTYVLIMKNNENLHSFVVRKLGKDASVKPYEPEDGFKSGLVDEEGIERMPSQKEIQAVQDYQDRSMKRTFTKSNALGAVNATVQFREFTHIAYRAALRGHLQRLGPTIDHAEAKARAASLAWQGAGKLALARKRLGSTSSLADAVIVAKDVNDHADAPKPGEAADSKDAAPPVQAPTETPSSEQQEDNATDAQNAAAAAVAKLDPNTPAGNLVVVKDAGTVDEEDEEEPPSTPFEIPESIGARIFWAYSLPLTLAMYFTLPNCQNPKWKNWFLFTFFASLVWIAVFSYFMVWWASVIGYAIGIPDAVMGLTILAGGTSIPDALSSVIVARNGFGDMAVSSSIGSNVFDINVGLPLPWLIKTAAVDPGGTVEIKSCGLFPSVITLLLMVLFVIISIKCTGWVLSVKLGYIMFVLYLLFVAQSLLLEYGVINFGSDCSN